MKKKLFKAFLIAALLLSTNSCKKDETPTSSSTLIFDENTFGKNDGITKIEVLNVPSSPIEIGRFKEAGITLEITYVNYQVEKYLLDETFFKGEAISLISTPGKKHITLLFKDNRISFDVEMIEPKTPVYFTVTFLDRDNNQLSKDVVPYLGTAKYNGHSLDDYIENDYKYSFSSWSSSLENIHCDLEVKPIYEKRHIVYEKDYTSYYPYIPLASRYQFAPDDHILLYLGRMSYFPLSISDIYTHDDELGKEIELTYDGSKSIKNTFLPYFREAINKAYFYNKGDIYNGTLEGEENLYFKEDSFTMNDEFAYTSNSNSPKFIKNLSAPNYTGTTRYDGSVSTFMPLDEFKVKLADKYHETTVKDYIYPNDQKGFYRMLMTCSIDAYMDINATKISDTSYKINSVKFGFFPIWDSINYIKEFSKTISFNDEAIIPFEITSNDMYESLKNGFSKNI